MSTYFFLVFQIEIDAANNCDERHKTKHNQCSHIIFLSLFYLGQAKGRYWHKYTTYFYVNKHTNIKIVSPFGFSLSSSFSPTYQRTSEPFLIYSTTSNRCSYDWIPSGENTSTISLYAPGLSATHGCSFMVPPNLDRPVGVYIAPLEGRGSRSL